MSSAIDPTKPTSAIAFTADVRANFAAAKSEIEALQAASGGGFLPITGGTMQGPLVLDADPVAALEAATRQYVNAHTDPGGPFLPISGGSLQGPLTLSADPTTAMQAATKQYADTKLSDAPNDANAYGRHALGWSPVLPMSGGAVQGAVRGWSFMHDWRSSNPDYGGFGFWDTDTASGFGFFAYNTSNFSVGPMSQSGAGFSGASITFDVNVGSLWVSGGLKLGNVNSDPSSIVGGIEMYPGYGGFGVTAGTLNYNWTGTQQFLQGATPIMYISSGLYMQTPLVLAADPTTALSAATKQYVDAQIAAGGTFIDAPSDGHSYGRLNAAWTQVLPLAGGTLSGDLTITSARNLNFQAVSTNTGQIFSNANFGVVVEGFAGGLGDVCLTSRSASAELRILSDSTVWMNGVTIAAAGTMTLVADPTTALQAATKQYADKMLPLIGGTLTGGLSFGAASAGSTDLSRHITLNTDGRGFNAGSGGSVRYVTTASGSHQFYTGTTPTTQFMATETYFNNPIYFYAGATISTGSLTLNADPTTALQAATKQYVDANAGGAGSIATAFTSSGTYADPGSGTYVGVLLYGGGGSGGGGAGNATSTQRTGGTGGGGGAAAYRVFRRADLTFPVTVTVGAGGASVSGNTSGTNGGNTSFGNYITAYGGGGGTFTTGGSSGGSGGGQAGAGLPGGAASNVGGAPVGITSTTVYNNIGFGGGAAPDTGIGGCAEWGGGGGGGAIQTQAGSSGGSSICGGAAGGGGGGVNNSNVPTAGGAGGSGGSYVAGSGPAGGAINGNAGQGVAIAGNSTRGGQGGAGGGGNVSAPGGNAGAGAFPGGGGGGGGGGVTTGGTSGAGGNGVVYVVAW